MVLYERNWKEVEIVVQREELRIVNLSTLIEKAWAKSKLMEELMKQRSTEVEKDKEILELQKEKVKELQWKHLRTGAQRNLVQRTRWCELQRTLKKVIPIMKGTQPFKWKNNLEREEQAGKGNRRVFVNIPEKKKGI